MKLTQEQKQLLVDDYDRFRVMALLSNNYLNEELIMEAYKANDLLQPIIDDGTYIYQEISDKLKILIQVEDMSTWGKNDLAWYQLYRKQHRKSRRKKISNEQYFEALKIVVKLLAHFNVDNNLVCNCEHRSELFGSDELIDEDCILFPYAPDEMFLIKKVGSNANDEHSWCLLNLG